MARRQCHSLLVLSWLVVLSLFAIPSPLWAQEDDPALRKRFVQGVAQSATELESVSFRAKFVSVFTGKEKGASEKTDTRNYEVAIRGTYLLETGVHKDTKNTFFRGRNHDYAFVLERSSDGRRPSLRFIEQIGVDPKVDARIARIEETPRMLALGGFHLWGDPLFRLVESDSFAIERVYAVSSGDKDLVRVEFEQRVHDPGRSFNYQITDGFVVCDPARAWALTEYGGTKSNFMNKCNSVQNVVLEYGEAIGGIPIATKTVRTMSLCYSDADFECDNVMAEDVVRDSDYDTREVLTTEIVSRDVPEAEFYLTHYGLPEPTFRRSWSGTWVWYLLAGIICLVVAIVVRRRRVIGVCVLVLAFTGGEVRSQDDESALCSRFLAAVAKAEKRCRRAPGSILVKAITTTQLSPKTVDADYSPELLAKLRQESANLTKPRIVATSEYAGRSDLQLEMGTRDGFEFVTARNRRYAFHIQRAPELKGYSLQFLQRIGGDPAVDALIDEAALRSVVATRSLAWSMFGKRLWEWIDSPDFKIEGTSEVQSGGETLVRIDFEHLVDEVRPGRPCLSDGYLICDPAADWALREFEASFINPVQGVAVTRQRGSLEYAETTKGLPLPIPETISLSTNWINDAKNTDWTITTLEVISTDVPEEIFYLSHYGLPEPTFRRSWLGTWVWYLAAGIVCLIVAAAIFKRRTARWRW